MAGCGMALTAAVPGFRGRFNLSQDSLVFQGEDEVAARLLRRNLEHTGAGIG